MPDPDPQPPQPRAVSPARWLLMLLPSVPIILAPVVADAQIRSRSLTMSDDIIGVSLGSLFWAFCISALLSLVMGLLLEKWRYGTIEYFARAVLYMLSIFGTNCLIAFAGCAVGSAFYK